MTLNVDPLRIDVLRLPFVCFPCSIENCTEKKRNFSDQLFDSLKVSFKKKQKQNGQSFDWLLRFGARHSSAIQGAAEKGKIERKKPERPARCTCTVRISNKKKISSAYIFSIRKERNVTSKMP